MNHPEDNLDNTIRSLRENLGERRDPEQDVVPAYPAHNEAQPLPPTVGQPQSLRLNIPTSPDIAWKVLLGSIILVYLVEVVLSRNLEPTIDVLYLLGGKSNPDIKAGQYWRLIAPMFLHGSILHILFNGYSLFALGPTVERFFGTLRFLAVYFVAGLAGSVASYAFSSSLSVGASGAIFGLVGALGAFFYASRKTFGEMARQQLGGLITVVMLNLFIGFSSGGVIDNSAHLGGLLGGLIIGWLLAPRYTIDERLYPPTIVRTNLTGGWLGVSIVLLVLVALVGFVIVPPVASGG